MTGGAFDGLRDAGVSVKTACRLTGRSTATYYRCRQTPVLGPPAPRPAPVNKLTEAERQHVLGLLRSEAYCDLTPAQVWARLLDDGIYLCSISTMYRLLAIAGENRERRRQRTHPAKKKTELIATRPCQVWSWDITKLRGPTRGVTYDLYVIIDIFSRYYNHEHRHSGIGLHTPASVHYGTAKKIREQRAETLNAAYAANPTRFRGRRPTPPKLPTVAWINDPSREALIHNK